MTTAEFDVFLNHNRAQKDWTRALACRLRDAGLKVWFDEWCLRGGENWIIGLQIFERFLGLDHPSAHTVRSNLERLGEESAD